jgi:hypothetical protein
MAPNTKGIFISYRRDQSTGYAGRIADSFQAYFGEDIVVSDIDSIGPDLDFVEAIERALDSCAVMLVVIGRSWVAALKEHEQTGQEDYLRLEVATALERNIRVMPVLIQGASMPRADELPNDLAPLTRSQAFELHSASWRDDIRQLITILDNVLERPVSKQPDILSPETIFLSYSRIDWDEFVEPLVIELRQQGFKVWIDQLGIRSGTDWGDAVDEALKTCQRMVLCVSPNSMQSNQVKMEYRSFMRRNKTVLPLICREVEVEDMPYDLQGIQFRSYKARAKLIEELME